MSRKKLILVVPGLRGTPQKWEPLLARLKADPSVTEGADLRWEYWSHNASYLSIGRARRIAQDLRATINGFDLRDGPFDEIFLIGHSLGAMLVRDAYLLECRAYDIGAAGLGPEIPANSWARRVSRITLFASICRGFNPEVDLRTRIGVAVARLLGFYGAMLASDLQQGSAYVTSLRLAWIRYFHRVCGTMDEPTVVQLLGTADTMVRRADSIDIEQFSNSALVDIPGASHDTLYRVDLASNPDLVYAVIRSVLLPDYRSPTARIPVQFPDPKIVFVLHGIRASNLGWVEEVADIIRTGYPGTLVVTPTYGYFSALHFFLPWTRRTKARWFQDQYGELMSKYPEAQFFFIGHSNATYMLGRSMANVPMMRFVRAYIAGSVLPAGYDWRVRFSSGQMQALRSDTSAWDCPVGLLCSGLSFMRDIGTGGFSGFTCAPPEPQVREYRSYQGGHSKPLEDRLNLKRIVDEVMTGHPYPPEVQIRPPRRWFDFLSRLMKFLMPIALAALAAAVLYYAIFSAASWSLGTMVIVLIGIFLLGVLLLTF
jgi:alpha-beta hydrolase superfamily lysophospholipase